MTEVAQTRPFATATDTGTGVLQTFVTAGPSTIVADVSVAQGGLDLGPDPHELVAAGLVSYAGFARPAPSGAMARVWRVTP